MKTILLLSLFLSMSVAMSSAQAVTFNPLVCKNPGAPKKSKAGVISGLTDEYIDGYFRFIYANRYEDTNPKQILILANAFASKLEADRTLLARIEAEIARDPSPSKKADLEYLKERTLSYITMEQLAIAEGALYTERAQGLNRGNGFTPVGRAFLEAQIRHYVEATKRRPHFVDCGLTDVEIFSIMTYTEDAYAIINSRMREGNTRDVEFITREISNGLAKLAPFKGEVNRKQGMNPQQLKEACLGCVFETKAYTSTSLQSLFAEDYELFIKSKTGRWIAPIAGLLSRGEDEILFPPGAKFRVTDIKGKKYFLEEIE